MSHNPTQTVIMTVIRGIRVPRTGKARQVIQTD